MIIASCSRRPQFAAQRGGKIDERVFAGWSVERLRHRFIDPRHGFHRLVAHRIDVGALDGALNYAVAGEVEDRRRGLLVHDAGVLEVRVKLAAGSMMKRPIAPTCLPF